MATTASGKWGRQLAFWGPMAAAAGFALVLFIRAVPSVDNYFARAEGKAIPVGALSPDGSLIVVIRDDGAAEVQDAKGARLGLVRGHGARIVNAVFTTDGKFVRSIDTNGTLMDTAVDELPVLGVVSASAPELRSWTAKRIWEPIGKSVETVRLMACEMEQSLCLLEFREPEMVMLPTGSFKMGSPSTEPGRDNDESPQREVRIEYQLAVGRYEVTWDEWLVCVSEGGCGGHVPEDPGWGRGSRPIVNVSWDDVQLYVQWLNERTGLTGRPDRYRLPTEAEWEYAARAGSAERWSFGEDESQLGEYAWYDGNANSRTQHVGGKEANPYGLHDMYGNVSEWTEDRWNGSYTGAPVDGSTSATGDSSIRVIRGGSWIDAPKHLRSASRYWYTRDFRGKNVGFRLARTLPP